MGNKEIKIVVCARGGVVQNVYTDDKNVAVMVWDWDDKAEEFNDPNKCMKEFDKVTEGMENVY